MSNRIPVEPTTLQFDYNPKAGTLTLEARGVPLDKILWEISKAGGVNIRLPRGGEDPLAPVSISLKNLPLDGAVKRLFPGTNAIYTYAGTPGADGQPGQSRLTGIIVLSIPPV